MIVRTADSRLDATIRLAIELAAHYLGTRCAETAVQTARAAGITMRERLE
jgi:hypothetical protein